MHKLLLPLLPLLPLITITFLLCACSSSKSTTSAPSALTTSIISALKNNCNVEASPLSDQPNACKIILSDPDMVAEPNVTGYNNNMKAHIECIVNTLQQLAPSAKFTVHGYTDNVGSYDENLKISQKRALAIGNLIIRTGIDSTQVSTIGHSYNDPIADNRLIEGRAKNRRIELVIAQ